MGFTEGLINYAMDVNQKPLNDQIIEQFEKSFLDYLAVVYTGSKTKTGKRVFNYFNKLGGSDSQALGFDKKLTHVNAAFVNGTSAHSLDFDDGFTKGSVHINSVIFPAVMACVEKYEKTGEDLIRAVLVGYEVAIKIASTIHPYSREKGFHNTPVAGVFGAAAAVTVLLGGKHQEMTSAFGNALSFAGGTFAFLGSGSEVKRIHPGIAARDGIIAAELALEGLQGPANIFERKDGLFDVFSETPIQDFSKDLELFNIYIKPYPACRHLHVVIEALKEFKKNHRNFDIKEIKKMRIGVHKVASYHNHKVINTLIDAQMSIPYAAAVSLIDDDVIIKSFDVDREDRENINHLMNLIDVTEDSDCELLYPKTRKTNIKITMENGEEHEFSYDKKVGEPPNPMTMKDVIKKFSTNCKDIIGEKEMENWIQKVLSIKGNLLKKIF
ncbi:hypothetical protein DCC39_16190 [Pueribacillus theae]|uniref:MmgE/PrpD family protein n=1 Tax=Pueribacillus theae TaxID=2171751 RepID=A0A2U1JRJ7_9BACI|nr:MmgE/PrpD family protein [Pueribacillus theae]PWA07791.1 hypothetical protein DCC39_16190 [Pueribacillus theae]